jgi:hypothetical protein
LGRGGGGTQDGLAQRVHDIDRLAELTVLKVQAEPRHRFVE